MELEKHGLTPGGWRAEAEERGRREAQEKMDLWEKQYKKEREVTCPHCEHVCDNDDGFYPVSYWAEDGPEERDCPSCEKTFFVEEHVARTWSTAKTAKELQDL